MAACGTSSSTTAELAAPKTGNGTGQASPILGANLVDVACATTNLCAAVGIGFDPKSETAPFASSSDGGLSWRSDNSSGPANTKLTSVACGPTGCLAVGRSLLGALVFRLGSGSTSWSPATKPTASALAEATACAARRWCAAIYSDATHRWMATTLDNGATWRMGSDLPLGNGPVFRLNCTDASHCIASGTDAQGHGSITATSDGGATWTPANLGSPTVIRVWDAACRTASDCVALVDVENESATALITSSDGGVSFTAPITPWSAVASPRALTCTISSCIIVGGDAGGHGAAAVYSPSGTGAKIALRFAPTPLISVSCVSASRCSGAGLGSLVVMTPSVPKGSKQQGGQFRG